MQLELLGNILLPFKVSIFFNGFVIVCRWSKFVNFVHLDQIYSMIFYRLYQSYNTYFLEILLVKQVN